MGRKRKPSSGAVFILFACVAFCLACAPNGCWLFSSTRADSQKGKQQPRLRLRSALNSRIDWLDVGNQGSTTYRRFFVDSSGERFSPWHDLPLSTEDEGVRMVTEIPKMTRAKMEIATDEPHNPIAQDMKDGKLRDYPGPIYWNYGFIPQTWEDPTQGHEDLEALGDNDPLDVVEVGSRVHQQGEISKVKILGALAMIDSGELDWKIIAIDAADQDAANINNIDDLDLLKPGVTSGIREWFRWYKTPDGKPLNRFGFEEKFLNRDAAFDVIDETHKAWKHLRGGNSQVKDLWVGN